MAFKIRNGELTRFIPEPGETEVVIPDDVMNIGKGAFQCCTILTSVTIPDSVTSIGEVAFEGCMKLTNL